MGRIFLVFKDMYVGFCERNIKSLSGVMMRYREFLEISGV
jgi:hypothetical protein